MTRNGWARGRRARRAIHQRITINFSAADDDNRLAAILRDQAPAVRGIIEQERLRRMTLGLLLAPGERFILNGDHFILRELAQQHLDDYAEAEAITARAIAAGRIVEIDSGRRPGTLERLARWIRLRWQRAEEGDA